MDGVDGELMGVTGVVEPAVGGRLVLHGAACGCACGGRVAGESNRDQTRDLQ